MKLFNKIMYHGSAKRFDKFEYEFIDTGKNGHAHGWGIYLAANKSTSESYRPVDETTYYGGKTIEEVLNEKGIECPYFIEWYNDNYKTIINDLSGKLARRIETVKQRDTETASQLQKVLDILSELDDAKDERTGMLATVELPDDVVLVEEHTPLNQQSEFIQNVCKKVFANHFEQVVDEDRFRNLADNICDSLFEGTAEDKNTIKNAIHLSAEFFRPDGYSGRTKEDTINALSKLLSSYNVICHCSVEELFDKLVQCRNDSLVDNSSKNLELTFRQLYVKYDEKETALELRDNGVDGITYDGAIDRECIVLFNLDKANIINRE